MARSGTSAITRVVNLLGIPGPREDDLKPADDDNPRGYWESQALTSLNRRLLVAVGGAPYGPAPVFPASWLDDPGLDELRMEARLLMPRIHPRAPWVWKDPRTSLTLPFWIDVARVDPIVVLVYRDPLEVADSLVQRDDAPIPITVAVWERYNRAALVNSRGLPAFVVRYDRLIVEPLVVATELAAFLRVQGLHIEDPGQELEAFVDPALRRSRPGSRTRSLPSPEQLELLGILEELQGGHQVLSVRELPVETPWVDGLLEAERTTGMLDWLRERRQAARAREGQIARRTALGFEVRVVRGGAAWRALSLFRRLLDRLSLRGA